MQHQVMLVAIFIQIKGDHTCKMTSLRLHRLLNYLYSARYYISDSTLHVVELNNFPI